MRDAKDGGQRRHMRFQPDQVEIALIQFSDGEADDFFFEPDAAGLVVEEAYGGCGLVALSSTSPEPLTEDMPCLVKIGTLGPMRARVRWVKKLDDDVCKLGIEYLDAP